MKYLGKTQEELDRIEMQRKLDRANEDLEFLKKACESLLPKGKQESYVVELSNGKQVTIDADDVRLPRSSSLPFHMTPTADNSVHMFLNNKLVAYFPAVVSVIQRDHEYTKKILKG